MADIYPYWPNGRTVSNAAAHAVGVLITKAAQPDASEYVSAVIEDGSGQLAHDLERKTQLGVQDQQLLAADRHADQRTSRKIAGIPAYGYRPLRPGSVEWKSAQGASPAGEEAF